MYKVQKTCRSDPSDIIYHAFYYDPQRKRYTINDLMSDDIGVLEEITDKVLKGKIVFE